MGGHRWAYILGVIFLTSVLAGCGRPAPSAQSDLVGYISQDEPYARPILEAFTRETGIRVRPVFDTEAGKSRGLAERILAERGKPRAAVFWSSEVLQMVRLAEAGALEPYRSPSAEGIPARYRDSGDRWTGFAGRFRVLVVRSDRLAARGLSPPKSLLELTDARWRNATVMAQPLFGTTTTECAALFQKLGAGRATAYLRGRQENGVKIVDGNSPSAEAVARGDALVGQTDTDDAFVRRDRGAKLEVIYPDQAGLGTLLIPNTAGLIRGGPQPEAARRFLDFLLSRETELRLAALPARQLPLHTGLETALPESVRLLTRVRTMEVDYSRLAEQQRFLEPLLRGLFLR